MIQDKLEKNIIESIQQLNIPGPDPDFEAKLKAQFIHKATQTRRNRRVYRTVKYSGAIAATVLIGSFLYTTDIWKQRMDTQEPSDQSNTQDVRYPTISTVHWEEFDQDISNGYDYLTAPSQEFHLFIDQDRKKLYMVKEHQATLLFEGTGQLANMQIVQIPTRPDTYYLFVREEEQVAQQPENMHTFVFEINENGDKKEIGNIPQGGYYSSHKVIWSPSGERAFLTFENNEGYWVGGIIDEETLQFKRLYGADMPKTPKNPAYEMPVIRPWVASWIDDGRILFYNSPGQAFYVLNVDEGFAYELKGAMPEFVNEAYQVKAIRPLSDSRYALIEIGIPQFDASFSGDQRTYLLDIEEQTLKQVSLPNGIKVEKYDQIVLEEYTPGKILMGVVYPVKSNQYAVQLETFEVKSKRYSGALTLGYEYPVYLDRELKLSPNGQYAAIRTIGYPNGAESQVISVIHLGTGQRIQSINYDGYPATYEWKDAHTLIVGDEVIEVNGK